MNNERAKTIDVPFSRGVRQDIESRTAPLGALTAADNLEFDHQNRLMRRDAYEKLGTTLLGKTNVINYPVRRAVQAPGGERLLFTDENFFAYYPSRSGMTEGGIDTERSFERATLRETLGIAADECGFIDFCEGCAVNGYAVYAYARADGNPVPTVDFVYLDVISIKDGARVLTQQVISGSFGYATDGGQVRCVVSGGSNVVFVVWAGDTLSGSGTKLIYAKVTLGATVTVGPATILVGDTDTPRVFDVDTMASGWVLVYGQNAGAHQALVQTYDSTPTSTHAFVWKAAAGTAAWQPSALGITGDSAFTAPRIHVSGYDPATFKIEYVLLTPTLTGPTYGNFDPGLDHAKPAKQMTLAHVNHFVSLLLVSNYTSSPATGPRGHLYCHFVIEDGSHVAIKDFANYTLASKVYVDKRPVGAFFAMARFDDPSGFQNHFLLLDFGSFAATGKVVPTFHVANGRVPLAPDNSYTGIGGILDLSFEEPGLFEVFLKQNVGASQISGNQVTTYRCTSCRSDRFLSTPCQGEAVVGGGTPLTYDGQRLVELSFYSYPVCTGITPSATLGSIAQGIYQYRLVYEWTDAKGNRHQSPACPAVTADLSGGAYAAGTNKNVVAFAAYHATRKQYRFLFSFDPHTDETAPVRVVAYRTVVGSSGPFYRLPTAGTNNVQSVNPGSLTDTYADAAINVNEVLYEKDGGRGELATIAPPPCVHMTTHQQRLWGVDGEDPERIWCTKTLSPLTAPGYSPALQVFIPGAGKINGLGGQDGKLYAFATNGIYLASFGDGPDNAGGGSFPSPQLISTDAQCDDPRGVLTASNGIYFTGRDKWGTGIYLIRRGDGNPLPIGRRIRVDLASYPVCRGAIDRIDKSRVEFLFTENDFSADPNNKHSIVAYYHYDLLDEEGVGQWTIARPASGNDSGDVTEFECLGLWTETQDKALDAGPPKMNSILADTFGAVAAQRALVMRDFGSSIPATLIETADVRAFGLTGFGAIRGVTMYGTKVSADPIRMEASYDAGINWADVHSFGSAPVGGAMPILFRWETPTQKLPDGGMVRFRVADEYEGEFEPGTSWFHGLSIEVDPLGGDARLSEAKRG